MARLARWLSLICCAWLLVCLANQSASSPATFASTPTPAAQLFLPIALRSLAWNLAPTPTPIPGLPLIRIISIVPDGRDEYITLTNRGTTAQSLTGWHIVSLIGHQSYQFPDGFTLEPAQYVRVHSGPDALNNPPADLLWGIGYIWNNAGDRAEVRDAAGALVDGYCYRSGCNP